MNPLPPEKILLLHEMLQETSDILEFPIEDTVNCFYCGVGMKWGLPNTLLIVIKDDDTNRFHNEMSTTDGAGGSAYLDSRVDKRIGVWNPPNRKYQFRYRVIFERVFNGVASYNVIFDHDWVNDNDPYKGGLSIIHEIIQLQDLIAFI